MTNTIIRQTPGWPLSFSFPGQQISWKNESTMVTDQQVYDVIKAIQVQVTRDFFPAWSINAQLNTWDVHQAATQWQLIFLDDTDQANALGYHMLTPNGLPLAKVFVKTTFNAGLRWSVVASHEVLEMLVDPYCDKVIFNQDTPNTGTMFACEVCDPVESDEMGYDVGSIRVSNFIYPSWFQPGMQGPYDFLGQIAAPLTIGTNGYMSFFKVGQNNNQWQQSFATTRRYGLPVPSTQRLEQRAIPKDIRVRSQL